MKHQLLLLALLYITIPGRGQKNQDLIESFNQMVENRQYESAYKFLNKADPQNSKPDLVILKTQLMLDYYTKSIMHKMFSLKDLKADENLDSLRAGDGNFNSYLFQADSIILKLIKKYPQNYKLYKTLGFYYHEVSIKYPNQWLIPDSILIPAFRNYYMEAYKHDVFDYYSLFGIGYAYLLENHAAEAVGFFQKSIELNPNYPTSHYNLAYAYLYLNKRDKAIMEARKAFELYDYPFLKADAAKLIATSYNELNDFGNALNYFKKADQLNPYDYDILKPLLNLQINIRDSLYKQNTLRIFQLDPTAGEMYEDLLKIYTSARLPYELLDFFESQKSLFSGNNIVMANLNMYCGVILYRVNEPVKSRENFVNAFNYYKQVFNPSHPIFKTIQTYVKQIDYYNQH